MGEPLGKSGWIQWIVIFNRLPVIKLEILVFGALMMCWHLYWIAVYLEAASVPVENLIAAQP